MALHALKNQPKVNHFDQSYRNLFTAKPGELLPVYFNLLNPGDSIKIDASHFTRTAPLQTAAFTRLRENVQFFAVPLSALWRFFPDVYKNMPTDMYGNSTSQYSDKPVSVTNTSTDLFNTKLTTSLPYLTSIGLQQSVLTYLNSVYNYCRSNSFVLISELINDLNTFSSNSAFAKSGYPTTPLATYLNTLKHSTLFNYGELRFQSSAKLLSYLNFGNFGYYMSYDKTNQVPISNPDLSAHIAPLSNTSLSIFPLLAYHKIANDFYRYRQWMPYNAQTCNIDWLKPTDNMNLDSVLNVQVNNVLTSDSSFYSPIQNLVSWVDLEFGNLNLDYFNGVLPNSQYGDMTVAPSTLPAGELLVDLARPQGSFTGNGTNIATNNQLSQHSLPSDLAIRDSDGVKAGDVTLESSQDSLVNLRIDTLRNAIMSQRYKEIQASSDTTYVDLIQKHFGIKPKDYDQYRSHFIGGYDSQFDINPQINQNFVNGGSATYSAAPTGRGNGSISFTCESSPCIILGIYCCTPLMEYANIGLDRRHQLSDVTDFVIPEFDSIGMQTTRFTELMTPDFITDNFDDYPVTGTFGYAPRYAEYKCEHDRVNGEFLYSLNSWVNPFDANYLSNFSFEFDDMNDSMSSAFLRNLPLALQKCSPALTASIFVNQGFSWLSDDNLYVGSFFKVDVTRRLSKTGLPYAE